ncbi:DUF3105 domain-containing protein [Kineosporia sp. J2-2]|uniref:DUF3105 domain-containing protein n=1 Tax=Kineosporia corallincola TaxID=2835133 RepID=A0ABS5TKU8_9ACTN|nr:DUF3105 domain-containing protein [Kineosporia corallincola]MBT0770698.1 DUF3105 domain-containing protein [Kineosporia corallincola]
MTNARKARQATAEKAAKLRAEQASRERRNRFALAAGATVIVLAVAGGVTAVVMNARSEQAKDDAVALTGVKTYKDLSQNHVSGTVKYEQTPPVGGDHAPVWLNCGIYDAPVANENAVHDLEHGAVWITYQPDLAESEVDELKDIVGNQTYITMSPYTDLPNPITLSAWGVQMSVDSASDPRIEKFIKEYKQGKQTPEMGAACTGGVGTPTG